MEFGRRCGRGERVGRSTDIIRAMPDGITKLFLLLMLASHVHLLAGAQGTTD
jgi:hypothetical protein